VERHPWTGSGFEGWRSITAQSRGSGDPATLDWHNAYVEALVEHGIPGFLLWATLLAGTIFGLSGMIWRGQRIGDPWMIDNAAMLRAALVAYAVGGSPWASPTGIDVQILCYSWIALRLAAETLRANNG
jgi:O-antigen ligase